MVARTKTVSGVAQNVNAYTILSDLTFERTTYEEYTIVANAVREFNAALIVPDLFMTIFSGVKATDAKVMPARPGAYAGDTFSSTVASGATYLATTSQGGYGTISSGNMIVLSSADSG